MLPPYNIDEMLYGLRRVPEWEVVDMAGLVTTDEVIRAGLGVEPSTFPTDRIPDVQQAIDSAAEWVRQRVWGRSGCLMMELLEAALSEEFDGEVIFAPWLPPTITPPAVVVAPGRPFLVPSTHGGVTETWRVMVAVSSKNPDWPSHRSGGSPSARAKPPSRLVRYGGTSDGPDPATSTQSQIVVSVTEIAFRYCLAN